MRLSDFDKVKLQNTHLLLYTEEEFPQGGTFYNLEHSIPLKPTCRQFMTGRNIHPKLKKYEEIVEKDLIFEKESEAKFNILFDNLSADTELEVSAQLRSFDEFKRVNCEYFPEG